MAGIQVTKETFETEVVKADMTVLVDFWAPRCAPCMKLMPTIEEIANEVTDVKIVKLNVDEEPELAVKYKVMSIPTLIVFKNGEPVRTEVGGKSKDFILDMLK